ncbi:alpha-amylase family glycosyl hydrolase [Actinomarinicola tropica]|uniref:DUF3459 domain-containing protein n=1 Tax=Actinomarinicola tropica TaxID=2789776 RepID=A0A5Q2RKP0_9ACTN|nr:alpha-amylase family glycosyl hydrolase [Actinomarinicola tropica]QGG94986.1 DUF3459 domain-containing protein [Actinomarinicola tropica]
MAELRDDPRWWTEAVVYQIYPRSFRDGNGDGIGDLPGIIEGLDHVAELGVDAIWLSPIYRSPMADFGYDVADHTDVDPVFGTLDDADRLIARAHELGLRVLLDWVPNHTSDQHPWFQASRSSRDDPRRDWYVWRDPAPDGGPPNNWISAFKGVPAWTLDEATGQYYLHSFLAEQPDLNWSNPEVEAAMHDTLRFWLDRGVDGFRADVVHLIGKGEELADLPERKASNLVVSIDEPFTHELLRRIRALLDSYPQHPMMVGEVYLLKPGQTVGYLGDDDELHLTFDFRTLHTAWDAGALRSVITTVQSEFAPPLWPTWVLSNHDRPRHRSRYGSLERARAAAVLTATVRGTPFIYAGEELGLEDAEIPADRVVDPDGRDGERAPIPWTTEPDHGWGPDPWLPFPPDSGDLSVEAQVADPRSTLHLYRELLGLRRAEATLRRGTMHVLGPDPERPEVLELHRQLEGETIAVAVNLGEGPVTIERPGTLLASSRPERERDVDFDGHLDVDEAVVVRTT